MSNYYEPPEELEAEDRDYIRALFSMKEELEAVAWYHQRVATCSDEQLKEVLAHNRNEEMEHATMLMEWLRRSMPGWNEQMSKYLFSTAALTEIETEGEGEVKTTKAERAGASDLGIGSLKER